jgi:ribosomal protein S18 acetylase RimI-like enzyme
MERQRRQSRGRHEYMMLKSAPENTKAIEFYERFDFQQICI